MLLSIGDLVEEFIVDVGDEPRRGRVLLLEQFVSAVGQPPMSLPSRASEEAQRDSWVR